MFDAQDELKKYTMCVRTQYRIAESINYRLWKRGSYSPETAVTFVRGKYLGKRGVIENVTRKKYLKIRIDFYDEKKTYPLVTVPPTSVEYAYNPNLVELMKKKSRDHRRVINNLHGVFVNASESESSDDEGLYRFG